MSKSVTVRDAPSSLARIRATGPAPTMTTPWRGEPARKSSPCSLSQPTPQVKRRGTVAVVTTAMMTRMEKTSFEMSPARNAMPARIISTAPRSFMPMPMTRPSRQPPPLKR